MTHIDTTALVVAIGALIPLLTGLVSRAKSQAAKAAVDALAAAGAGSIATLLAQPNISIVGWLLQIGITWAAAIAASSGFWGPTGIVDRWVEWAAKQLAKIGIRLPDREAENIVEWLQAIFGDAIQFLGEEEAVLRLAGKSAPTPDEHSSAPFAECADEHCVQVEYSEPGGNGYGIHVHLDPNEDHAQAIVDHAQAIVDVAEHVAEEINKPAAIPPLQGPGHNFTDEGV